ncbi:MAG: Cna B-type domain-containing protein [Clostridia bacterium]|nr:Cna B-type domain-containing protein [Clostridia bacterium]
MYDELVTQSAGFYKKHIRRRRWLRVLCVLSAIVVFVTTYALILPGITKERQSFCGLSEHTHTDACYEQREPELICELPEIVQHIHDHSCYDADTGELICTARQYDLHTHTDTCYDDGGILICQQEELCEHLHDHDCYEASTEDVELICGLSEHIHIDECYIDLNADIEDASVWEATLPELTGVWQDDLVAIAESQLGYSESESNIVIDSDITRGYTRYGEWAEDPYGDWSGYFLDFCISYTDIDPEYFPVDKDTELWIELLNESGYYRDPSFEPNAGDIVFFRDGRTALIAEYDSVIKTIEGDVNGTVGYVEHEKDEGIIGYADLNAAYEYYHSKQPIEQEYRDDTVTVKATYTAQAEIPDGATLSVKPITDADTQNLRYDQAKDAIDSANGQINEANITAFRLYDICFICEDKEIQPNDSVKIEITLNDLKADQSNDVSVVHFMQEGTELPVLEECDIGDELTVGFSVDSFSEFAIVTSTQNTLEFVSMTRNNDRSLSVIDPYAIISGNSALLLAADAEGNPYLSATTAYSHDIDTNLTVDIRAQQWKITANGGSYYVHSNFEGENVYLLIDAGVLTLTNTTDSASLFTLYWNAGVLRLSSNGYYLDPASETLLNTASTDLSFYSAPESGSIKVIFDATIGRPSYMDGNKRPYGQKYKYDGAGYRELNVTNGSTVVLPHNDPTSPDTANYISIHSNDGNPLNDWFELNGWYDAINKVYYDKSMLGKEIKVTASTIFYPEYIAKDYNAGYDNGNVIVGQPDTSDFINTYMFDYNEIFNVDKSYVSYFGTDSGGKYVTKWNVDTADPSGMVFFDYITPWGSDTGNIGYMLDRSLADTNGVTVNEEKTAGTRGSDITFPGTITSNILGGLGTSNVNNPRIDALFTKETIPGRVYLGEGDWFYNYDETIGFYYYNSAANAAAYNRDEQRFYVYDYPVRIDNNNSMHDFTPFTYRDTTVGDIASDGSPALREKDNEVNYWVGMQSDINFYLPEDSGSPLNVSSHGDDMQFRFSGDDDVWIFIDGKLVLDLGGVHDVVYGEINFATGKIKTGQAISSSQVADNVAGDYTEMPGLSATNTNGVTTYDLPHLEGGQYHTVTVYYLERGSALSNCAIYFNISPFYELEILKRDSVTGNGLEGAEFTVYTDPECTQVANLYTRDENGNLIGVDAVFYTDADGIARCEGLYAGGTYYIKETKPPDGYPDMSMYIIVANLAHPGESVTIAVDSTGKEWIYADEYVYSDEHNHRIELAVYNSKYIGGEQEIYVRKEWGEGSVPENVTLQLYANGIATDRTVDLNERTDWEAFLYKLPLNDEYGNKIDYTFKEISGPPGYTITITETEGHHDETTEVPGYWKEVNSLEDGKIYRFVNTVTGNAISCNSDDSISPSNANEMDHSTHWQAIATSGKFLLHNEYYGRDYLYIGAGSVSSTTTYNSNNNLITYSNGKLSATFRSGIWNRTYYITEGSTSYGSTTSQSSGATFKLYEWVPPTEETVDKTVSGWLVTNTPWPKTTSIPVVKEWDATVDSPPESASFSLYLVADGNQSQPQWIADLTLTAESGWKGSFENIDYPEDGSYYVVVENTTDYTVTFSSSTEAVYVNGSFVEGSRVEFDSGGNAVEIKATNTARILLPATGGKGTTRLYTIGGILLMTTAAILLVYNSRKRRLEDSGTP